MYCAFGKRALDSVTSAALLIVLLPVMTAVALAVRIWLGAPVLFRQQRAGLRGRPFTIFKFRTMTNARDGYGEMLPDENRLTRLGVFLRSTSLDELPELVNVLRGEMSLVGPRPLPARYLPRYTPEQARRHDVKPGITGWAQIHGRNAMSWDDKFALDLWYVEHESLALDIRIMAQTIYKTLRREGIAQPGHATASEFVGTDAGRR